MRARPLAFDGLDGGDAVAFDVELIDAPAQVDLAAALLANQLGDMFPELAGAVLGIEELLDERGFGLLLRDVG